MQHSLRTLLDEILDYAGLFPPASLMLKEAVDNYGRYRAAPLGWMVARFICPVARLGDLGLQCAQGFSSAAPARVAAIGSADPLSPEFIRDVRALEQFTRQHPATASIAALEMRLPAEELRDWTPEAVAEALDVMATRLVEHRFQDIEVFLEPVRTGDWHATVSRAIACLRLHDQTRGQPNPERIGLKLRTGGVDAVAVPPVADVAFTLAACRDAGVPLKFTAGLHQPLRHFDETLKTDVHGFLNVFIAGGLAHARGVDEPTITAILEETDPAAFVFGDECLRWRDFELTIDEIESARDEFVLSFGSCSVDGPLACLGRFGLL